MQVAAEQPSPDIQTSVRRAERTEPTSRPRPGDLSGSVRAAFLATANVAPIIALFVSVASYALAASPADQGSAPVYSLGVHVLAAVGINLMLTWGVLAAVFLALGCTSAERANTGAFAELQDALIGLRSQLDQLCPDRSQLTSKFCELLQYKENLANAIEARGPQWVLGYGYMSLLRRAHRAEEALITVQDKRIVIAGARYDLLRISESTLANKLELVAGLESAAQFLRGTIDENQSNNLTQSQHNGSTSTQDLSRASISPTQNVDPASLLSSNLLRVPSSEEEARTILRDVRRSINDFRDGIQAGFIRARNHLMVITIVTGFSLYCLLWLAIIAGVSPHLIKTMAGYYLVGMLIGLFARLNVESQNDTAVDDFGLSATRLISGPFMSGVAAVGGVLIVTLLSFSQIGMGISEDTSVTGLLDMTAHPLNLLVAATFGLTPTLLLDRLKQQADKYKQDLRSSEPLQKSTGSSNGSSSTA